MEIQLPFHPLVYLPHPPERQLPREAATGNLERVRREGKASLLLQILFNRKEAKAQDNYTIHKVGYLPPFCSGKE